MLSNIYLDCNSTTPADPEVVKAMTPYFEVNFGNPSSTGHPFGRTARNAVEKAREQMSSLLNCSPKEIYWTSGATESNNISILGLAHTYMNKSDKPHVITSEVEHKSVLAPCKVLKEWGFEVSIIKPNKFGEVTPDSVKKHLQPNTKFVSIMTANNEIGTINSIEEIAQLCQENKIFMHTDAAQAVGKIHIDLKKWQVDSLAISGHKMYGPKGVGAIYLRKGASLQPIMVGGGQESQLRPGTLNVPGIVGLGAAAYKAQLVIKKESQTISKMRDHLIESVLKHNPGAQLNGHPTKRLQGNISLSFNNIQHDDFALALSGLAYSSNSACSTEQDSLSYVLTAIGHSPQLALSTIRLGIGRANTQEDINFAIKKINGLYK